MHDLRRLSVQLEVLGPLPGALDARRAGLVLLFDVLIPEIGILEHVAISVDCARISDLTDVLLVSSHECPFDSMVRGVRSYDPSVSSILAPPRDVALDACPAFCRHALPSPSLQFVQDDRRC